MKLFNRGTFTMADDRSGGKGDSGNQPASDSDTADTGGKEQNHARPLFSAWIEAQPPEIQEMYQEDVSGLRTALSTERKGRQEAEQSVRELAKAAEEGSDAKNQLTKVADDLAELNRKADFYEQAHEAGVSNIKLAYLVAKQDDLFDRKGNLEVDALREAYPELFRSKKIPPSGAGEGSPTGLAPEDGMNQFIRRSAGRKT